eukprot:g69775.t1
MAPVADMANHPTGGSGRWHNTEHATVNKVNGISYSTDVALEKGQEVLVSYTHHADSVHFLLVYGYAVPDNPNDKCNSLLKSLRPEFIAKQLPLPAYLNKCGLE